MGTNPRPRRAPGGRPHPPRSSARTKGRSSGWSGPGPAHPCRWTRAHSATASGSWVGSGSARAGRRRRRARRGHRVGGDRRGGRGGHRCGGTEQRDPVGAASCGRQVAERVRGHAGRAGRPVGRPLGGTGSPRASRGEEGRARSTGTGTRGRPAARPRGGVVVTGAGRGTAWKVGFARNGRDGRGRGADRLVHHLLDPARERADIGGRAQPTEPTSRQPRRRRSPGVRCGSGRRRWRCPGPCDDLHGCRPAAGRR